MPHEFEGHEHWHEPVGLTPAGLSRFRRPASFYDRFMDAEGIGVIRGMRIEQLLDVPLQPWPRMGGRGVFVQLNGTEDLWGSYLVEVPGGGALAPEKHLHEEIFLVLEGRGTTEIWREGGLRHVFEWQKGSLFAIPTNALHRIVNATPNPALLLGATTLPAVLNALGDPRAVFESSYRPDAEDADDLFTAYDDIAPDPVRELALCRTHLLADALGCDLPLDNRFSPGYRQMELEMTHTVFHAAIGQHRPGRYARAHILPRGAALICLAGEGFSSVWPEHLGPTPWRDGLGDAVLTVPHRPFSMMAAGPGGGRWYHQSFGLSKQPLRHALLSGAAAPGRDPGPPGEEIVDPTALALGDGGTAIPYWMEDPMLRTRHTAAMLEHGIANRMRDDDYRTADADPL